MPIRKRRIRQLSKYFGHIPVGGVVLIGTSIDETSIERLVELGFTQDATEGESVLPHWRHGPISEFNAEGKYHKHKDQPMETAYRTVYWEWEQWSGRDTQTMWDWKDVPYDRYPRTFIEPPGVPLTVRVTADGTKYITCPEISYIEPNHGEILHRINLLLELFGVCSIVGNDYLPAPRGIIRRLDWDVLPAGEFPWRKLKSKVSDVLEVAGEGKSIVVASRLETIANRDPQFCAIGRAGFRGYVIFGFPERDTFIVESALYGNATYIFDADWEVLSMLTKAEIIRGDLAVARVVHNSAWFGAIEVYLPPVDEDV